jgi:hypothetical protein
LRQQGHAVPTSHHTNCHWHALTLTCAVVSQGPRHWHAACQEAFGMCHKDVRCCKEHVRQVFRCDQVLLLNHQLYFVVTITMHTFIQLPQVKFSCHCFPL